jgi:2-dehydro-3-deoxyphosphooctonate aldolase (KDO 8-P synthase)
LDDIKRYKNQMTTELGKNTFFLIAGPCVIESREHCLKMACEIKNIAIKHNIPLIFKASFDKANRTSIHGFRGVGIDEGLDILREVKETYNLPILTDVHLPEQALKVAQVVDVLQIPAFLCRQTDLVIACAQTGRDLNIKKGQMCNHIAMENAYQKVIETWKDMNYQFPKLETPNLSPIKQFRNSVNNSVNNQPMICLCERGNCYGSDDLVVDFRNLSLMSKIDNGNCLVVMDTTHSLQQPNRGTQTQGLRELIPSIARASVAVGLDGIFMEVHDNPDKALSDKATQWNLSKLDVLLSDLLNIHRVSKNRCLSN